MATTYFPFVSRNGDRKVLYTAFRQLFKSYFTTGVFMDDANSDHLRVEKAQGLTLTIRAGRANIEGVFYWQSEDETVTLTKSSSTKNYNILLRLNDNDSDRNVSLVVTETSDELIREDYIYDLVLATVTVPSNSEEIKGSNITDTRLDTDRCGMVSALIKEISTTDLFTQVNELMKEVKDENLQAMQNNRNAWNDWFATIKDILDGDTAGKLADRITDVEFMIMNNHFTQPINVDATNNLVDENGSNVLADWRYKIE